MNYIRFTFENIEPLKIADDSNSQGGQVEALSYVPGSALRGAIVNEFVKAGEFDSVKQWLLSDKVAFLNAYILADGHELLPSFKGFYEDKTESKNGSKNIENILTGDITSGNKRSSLGKYCYINGDSICYTGIEMGSDMKINKGKNQSDREVFRDQLNGDSICYTGIEMGSDMKINKGKNQSDREVFRNQYIVPGYRFAAYIAVPKEDPESEKLEEAVERIKEQGSLLLGGSRSFGYGKCEIQDVEMTDQLPYSEYALKGDAKDKLYMMLLSDMAMTNAAGENVGIDIELLKKKLATDNLNIEGCATSVVDVRGYNRTWKTWTPSVKMYEMGSVFKLTFKDNKISSETLKKVMDEGIGIRTNEGFGRVLFMDDYENLIRKTEINFRAKDEQDKKEESALDQGLNEDDLNTLMIVAKGHYQNLINRAENEYLADPKNSIDKFGLNGTQLGTIESILYANLYSEKDGWCELEKYFTNAKKKEEDRNTQKDFTSQSGISNFINEIKDTKLEDFLGLPGKVMGISFDDIFKDKGTDKIKQELIISLIRRANREGVDNE